MITPKEKAELIETWKAQSFSGHFCSATEAEGKKRQHCDIRVRMEGHPHAAESTMPGPQAGAEEGGGCPTDEPKVKDSLVVDQLTACVEEALTLEEEVQIHLNDPLMNHSGLSGGVPDEGYLDSFQ